MDPKTISTYNQIAKEYDEETTPFWEEIPATIFNKFSELVTGKVLDIGSGPGRDGLLLKNKGLDVICLDASETMIEMSKSRGLESVLGDFMDLPFPDHTFNGIWAYTSLLHIPKKDIDTALSEITRTLKPQGILGLGLIEGETEGYKDSDKNGNLRWFSFYTKEEIEKLLDKHGFEIIYFEIFKPRKKNYLNFIAQKRD